MNCTVHTILGADMQALYSAVSGARRLRTSHKRDGTGQELHKRFQRCVSHSLIRKVAHAMLGVMRESFHGPQYAGGSGRRLVTK